MFMFFEEIPLTVRQALAEQSLEINIYNKKSQIFTILPNHFINIKLDKITHLQVPESKIALGNTKEFIPGYVIFSQECEKTNENELWWGYLVNYQIPNEPNYRLVQKIIKV